MGRLEVRYEEMWNNFDLSVLCWLIELVFDDQLNLRICLRKME